MPKKDTNKLHTAARMKSARSRLTSPSATLTLGRVNKAGTRSPRAVRALQNQALSAVNVSETTDESEDVDAIETEDVVSPSLARPQRKRSQSHQEPELADTAPDPADTVSTPLNNLETTDESEGNDENVAPSNRAVSTPSSQKYFSPTYAAKQLTESPKLQKPTGSPTLRRPKLRRSLSNSSTRSHGSVRSSSRTPNKKFLKQRMASENMFAV
jgi:hypothetical protein